MRRVAKPCEGCTQPFTGKARQRFCGKRCATLATRPGCARWRQRRAVAGLFPIVDGSTIGYTVDQATGCWVWSGAVNPKTGYGVYRPRGGRTGTAHRFYFERSNGPVGPGLQLDHLCRNRRCVNPAHLEPVSAVVNVHRGRQTKLSPAKVIEIRARFERGHVMQKELCAEYGVCASAMHNIVHRHSWQSLEV